MKSIVTIDNTKFVFDNPKAALIALETLGGAKVVKDIDTFGKMDKYENLVKAIPFEMALSMKDIEIATPEQAKEAQELYDKNLAEYRSSPDYKQRHG